MLMANQLLLHKGHRKLPKKAK